MRSSFKMIICLSLIASPSARANEKKVKISEHQSWVGTWKSPEKIIYTGYLEIKECDKEGCGYYFSNGNISNVCQIGGKMKFEGPGKAVAIEVVDANGAAGKEKSPQAECRISLSKKGNKVTVTTVGQHCETFCGVHGVGPFGGTFTKSPSKDGNK